VETTYQNGQRHIETSHDATNGYVQVHTYNENGVMISSISDAPDGFYSYQYFDDNGVLVRWDLQDFFGRDSHRTYRPDGSYIDRVYEPDVGKTLVIEYDAAGNQISYAEE
jgi:antitoxin component YwqK of YwqJK toxin-antitoxin module